MQQSSWYTTYIHNIAVVLKENVLQRNSPPNILQNTAVVFQTYVLQRSSPQDILQKYHL